MKKIKTIMALTLSSLLVMGSMAGCVKPSTDSGTTGDTTTKVDDTKPVEITFWNYPNFATLDNTPGKYEQELVAAFNEKYPNIKVNVEMIDFNGGPEKINAAIASKTQPDIVYDFPGRIIEYGRQGVLAKLDDMMTADVKSDIPKNIVDASSLDGTLYMYPFNTTPFLISFNKTMLDELGLTDMLPLDKPDRLWTADDFTALLKAIKEKAPADVSPMVFYCKTNQGDQASRALISNLYGGTVINDDLSAYQLNSPEAVKGLQWVIDGINAGYIAKGGEAMTSGDAIDQYTQGKAACTIIYSSVLKNNNDAKKLSPFEDVFVPMPSPSKPNLEAFVGGLCVFDNGDAAKVDASKKFIDFLANDPTWSIKNLKATGGFSVRSSITGLYDNSEIKYAESMIKDLGKYYNAVPGFAEMRTHWFPALQDATLGNKTPQDALNTFVDQANATLKK